MIKKKKEKMADGYIIKKSVIFDGKNGIVYGENFDKEKPYAVLFFTEEKGKRYYFRTHPFTRKEQAIEDYVFRVSDFYKSAVNYRSKEIKTTSVEDQKKSIKDQLKENMLLIIRYDSELHAPPKKTDIDR